MIADSRRVTLKRFLGAWNAPTSDTGGTGQADPSNVPLQNGLLAKNVSYFGDGSVKTRFGNPRVFTPGDIVRSILNWLPIVSSAPQNLLVWLAQGVGVKLTSLASPAAGSTIMAETTSVAVSLQPQGARLYAGFMDANGIGVAPGQVYDRNLDVADTLFAPPMTDVPVVSTAVNTGSQLTPGTKNFGYMVKTRTGFITLPSPVASTSNNAFEPVSYTVGPTDSIIQVALTATWPSYASGIFLICTTTANPNQYFIIPNGSADGSYPVTGGTSSTLNMFLASVTDSYITDNYVDASPYFNQLSSTIAGTNPLDPAVITTYGQRMAYLALDGSGVPVCYISDPGNPQSISAAFGGVYLPGNLSMVTAFALGRTFYILGPHWTYSTTDNNGLPATWAQPQLVDGLIGAGGPFCISVSASQSYAWVANVIGLYLFSGAFPDRPVSYYQGGDWARINFAVSTKICVIDDKTNLRVHVIAPLDGATEPSHILTWDYSMRSLEGGISISPEAAKYSIGNIQNFALGCGCMVQNNTTRQVERWLAPADATQYVLREATAADVNPYRDDASQGIDSKYQTSLLPPNSIGQVYQHHGDQLRLTGSGTCHLNAYSLDGNTVAGPFSLTLTSLPNQEILQQYYILSEGCSFQIDNGNTADQWFKLAGAVHFFTDSFPQR